MHTRYTNVQFHEQGGKPEPIGTGVVWRVIWFGQPAPLHSPCRTPRTNRRGFQRGLLPNRWGYKAPFRCPLVTWRSPPRLPTPIHIHQQRCQPVQRIGGRNSHIANRIGGGDALVSVQVAFDKGVSTAVGWLDYLRVEQPCHLKFDSSPLTFSFPASMGAVSNPSCSAPWKGCGFGTSPMDRSPRNRAQGDGQRGRIGCSNQIRRGPLSLLHRRPSPNRLSLDSSRLPICMPSNALTWSS